MKFEITPQDMERSILSVNENGIAHCKRIVHSLFDDLNKFIQEFNSAHVSMPIQFSGDYLNALFNGNFHETAGRDLHSHISESPKYLQKMITESYKEFIEPLYEKANNIYTEYGRTCAKLIDKLPGYKLSEAFILSEDGKLSVNEEFETLLTERFTYYSTDINPDLAEKMEQYIKLENDIKLLVGKYSFKAVMASQCPIEYNEVYHEFNLAKLVSYVKNNGIDTFSLKEQ